ncbi:MAG: hypothetical protein AAF298_11660 [Cyanobacteria bacterium P01_A01_bin.40]
MPLKKVKAAMGHLDWVWRGNLAPAVRQSNPNANSGCFPSLIDLDRN